MTLSIETLEGKMVTIEEIDEDQAEDYISELEEEGMFNLEKETQKSQMPLLNNLQYAFA